MSKVGKVADDVWKSMEKVNGELFALTYGSLVMQLIEDLQDFELVNERLETMGYNIGVRLIEEFLAKTRLPRCQSFKDTADILVRVGFRMFLGITPSVANWSQDHTSFSVVMEDNPLAEFVELPEYASSLWYSNLYCGVIRGALEMIQYDADVKFVRDTLQGDEVTEIRVTLNRVIEEEIPAGEE